MADPRAAILLICLLLAGCVASAPTRTDTNPAPGSGSAAAVPSFSWAVSGCRELTASFDVDTPTLQAALPKGFTAGAGQTPGKTTVGIDAFSCKEGPYASFWAIATPPKELQGGVKQWYVKWDVLVADAAASDTLIAANASVRKGSVKFADALPLEGARATCTIDLAGLGTTTIEIGPYASTPGGGSAALREYMAGTVPGDIITWQATLAQSTRALAPGTVQAPAGSMAAKLYGGTTIPATVGMASSALTNATFWLGPPST